MSKWSAFKLILAGWDALQNEPNFMLVRYSIVELLMVLIINHDKLKAHKLLFTKAQVTSDNSKSCTIILRLLY